MTRDEENQLIAAAQQGDEAAFEKLYKRHRGLLWLCSHKAAREAGYTDYEDIEQVERIALWKAVTNFDASQKAQLNTYLSYVVRSQVQKAEIQSRLVGSRANLSEMQKRGHRRIRPARLDAPLAGTRRELTMGKILPDYRESTTRLGIELEDEVRLAEKLIDLALRETSDRN